MDHRPKKAMNDPSIGDLWKTAFGKEFGGLAQGDIKKKRKAPTQSSSFPTKTSENTKENTPTHAFAWTIVLRKRTHIALGLPSVETSSNVTSTCQYEQPTSQQPNFNGIVSSAPKMLDICA